MSGRGRCPCGSGLSLKEIILCAAPHSSTPVGSLLLPTASRGRRQFTHTVSNVSDVGPPHRLQIKRLCCFCFNDIITIFRGHPRSTSPPTLTKSNTIGVNQWCYVCAVCDELPIVFGVIILNFRGFSNRKHAFIVLIVL